MTVLDRPPVAPDREDADDVRRRIPSVTVALSLAGLLVVLAVALAVGAGGPASGGALVDRMLPVSRLVGRIAALGTVGALLFVAVLRPSAAPLPAASRGALRAASAWATAWAAATAVAALLTLSQLVGPGAITPAVLWTFVSGLPAGRASLVVLAMSVLVATLARRTRGPVGAGALLLLAAAGVVVPAVLTGHSAEADHHLLAVTGLGLHVLAASLWVGGLLALLVHGRGRDLAPAATRFSAVALACFVATGTSGVLAAWLIVDDLGPTAVFATGYGWLLAAKTAALTVLGVIGWWHRRRTLPRLRAGRPSSFRRFAAAEAGVMLATVALAVALSASPPPRGGERVRSPGGHDGTGPGRPGPRGHVRPRPRGALGDRPGRRGPLPRLRAGRRRLARHRAQRDRHRGHDHGAGRVLRRRGPRPCPDDLPGTRPAGVLPLHQPPLVVLHRGSRRAMSS